MKQFFLKWAVASVLLMVFAVVLAVVSNDPQALVWVPAGGIPLTGLYLLFAAYRNRGR